MKWILVKELEKKILIEQFEEEHDIVFPQRFKELVSQYNGGRPRPNIFDTEENKERVATKILSFNKGDLDNIWETYRNLQSRLPEGMIPIMADPFGNYICLDFDPFLDEPQVVFWEHDLNHQIVERIANSFIEFIDSLYGIE